MTASHFEDLLVFQRAYRMSLDVHRISLQFPRIEQFGLAEQIRRASKSICANLAEGFGKQERSAANSGAFCGSPPGSADEMQVWCAVLRRPRLRRRGRPDNAGATSTSRSPGCCRACIAAVFG